MTKYYKSSIGTGGLGLLVGGLIGFLSRPTGVLFGKLPFFHVLTRGATYEGVDQVLINLAQESFNVMLMGAVIGAAVGIVLGYFILGRK
ncbi:MAG: hypothetical protein U5N26_11455 [Candidatus Marinimicrobia bacterium]|nr:hypothetical protein [Candidatus Neomarinimicrobiota bacterium]